MLTVYTAAGAIPLEIDDYYIKELASGLDELVFSISIWNPHYQLIQEETNIKEESEEGAALYLVKAIDGGANTAQIKCQLDLDDWKSTMAIKYKSESATVAEIVEAVKPTGWTVINNSGISYRRTIQLDAATPMDVLDQCRSTFSEITFRFDNMAKTVTITNMEDGQNLGAFATRDLNLKRNDYKGKSTGFATRLYAYGKDGLSFASINDGKPYVENHTYSPRVICAPVWIDERYTIPENLLMDAQAKLDALAVPQRSFDCDVVDLASVDPEKYDFLSFPLFSIAGLIDDTHSGQKIDHRIMERWRYPNQPEKNKVVFSTVAPRIQSQVTQVIQSITNVNSDWNQQKAAYFNGLTAAILGANGGSVRLLDTNGDGEPDTLYIADDPDPESAVMVWRFNYQGWAASQNGYNGPFTIGATFANGGTLYANVLKVLNINADNITSGTINADSINVTNINGQNIKDATIGSGPLAANSVTTSKINGSAVTTAKINGSAVTTAKIDSEAVTNAKIGGGAVSYGKTSFTGTLDQVGVNKSNIESINTLFTTTLATQNLTVGGQFIFQNHQVQAISGYLRYTS